MKPIPSKKNSNDASCRLNIFLYRNVNQAVVNVTYIYNVSQGISSPELVALRTVFPHLLVVGCYTSVFFFFLISHSIDTQTTRTTLTYHR